MQIRTIAAGLAALAALSACSRAVMTRVPRGIEPVAGFEAPRYMGRWYEIARLDHRFERGMTNVTADYALNEDGSVRVVNSGVRNGRRKSVEGTARFKGDPSVASLAVSFFPGFPGGYQPVLLFQVQPDFLNTCDTARAQSAHTNGMAVALGDGSVRFVNGNIGVATWQAACDPQDGTPLGADW